MKPLEGITVLEFSTMITASFATMMMADQGAKVIKIEPIDMGDPMRYIGTSKGGISALFANCNRGKNSIRVNLKDEAGQSLVAELASSADVVIHNFRPGVMDSLNLGSDRLRNLNPSLVYVAISGFGTTGPLANAPAYDPIIQAHAGLTASQGAGAHAFVRNLICDKITAYTALQAVTAGLFVREKTGEGQHIDISMLDAGLFFIFPDGFMNNTLLDDDVNHQPHLADLLYQLTLTRDGAITLSAATAAQRAGLLRSLNLEHITSDVRFNTMEKMIVNMKLYRAEIESAFQQFHTDEILKRLADNDVPAARCLHFEEVLSHPQIASNDTVEVREHPVMGQMRVVRSPVRFDEGRLPAASHAPQHGEQTMQILIEAGVSTDRLADLESCGVIR